MPTTRIHLAIVLLALTPLTARPVIAQDEDARWNVAIVVHDGVELLDFAGPGEVFAAASNRNTSDNRPWFRVYAVAPSAEQIVSQDFLRIVPEFSVDTAPKPDIVVIPGGSTGVLLRDEGFMRWVESCLDQGGMALSVCTGAFVLADLGALDGKEITSHWSVLDALERETENATVRNDVRFVDNGAIVTTAGVSAGIDGALHVVARMLGYEHAQQTAHYMQYEWNPTEAEIAGYPQFNPQLDPVGRALESAAALREGGRVEEAIAAYRKITDEQPGSGEAWYYLGLLLHTTGDLDKALPAHLAAAEHGTGRFRLNGLYNAACASALLGRDDDALGYLERAAESGSRNAAWAVDDADLESISGHARFRAALARMWVNDARAQMGWNNDGVALERLGQAASFGFEDFGSILADPDFRRLHGSPEFRAMQQDHARGSSVDMVFQDEPGERLVVSGVVRDQSGRPVEGALMYVFNTDASGWYAPTGAMDEADARIFGYLRTDAEGRYEFRTVRPGGYPVPDDETGEARRIPSHIHVRISAAGHASYEQQWVFDDDPRLTAYWRAWAADWQRPILRPEPGPDDSLHATCNVVLSSD